MQLSAILYCNYHFTNKLLQLLRLRLFNNSTAQYTAPQALGKTFVYLSNVGLLRSLTVSLGWRSVKGGGRAGLGRLAVQGKCLRV